jgi:hypothetical protein
MVLTANDVQEFRILRAYDHEPGDVKYDDGCCRLC